MSQKLITKIEKGENGVLYGAVDITEGEWSVDQINRRIAAQGEQFVEQYQTYKMGPGDKKPIPGDELKPTKPTVENY